MEVCMLKFLLLVSAVGFAEPLDWMPCSSRLTSESFICVCNASYCDTVPQLDAQLDPDLVYVYLSDRESMRFNLSTSPISNTSGYGSSNVGTTLSPNPSLTYQTIIGFGGAFTDSAARNILTLPYDAQDKLLEAYFSPNGIKYTMGRVPIGCTDFSTRIYSYDSYPWDLDVQYFTLVREDLEGKKIAGRKLNLIGTAWAAPAWMKDDDQIFGTGSIRPYAYDAFAKYHVRFLNEYLQHGVEFFGISSGNEPVTALLSTRWDAKQMNEWIGNYLGPALNESFPDVKLFLLDDLATHIPDFMPIMEDKISQQFIEGWAIHPYTSIENLAPNLELAHQKNPDKMILQTEYCFFHPKKPVSLGSWTRGEDYAIRIIESLNHWSTTWIDWNLALDLTGGPTFLRNYVDAAIIVNGSEFYKQPVFYMQGHFSRFLTPGSTRIALQINTNENINATAAVDPNGTVVLVILNRGGEEEVIQIRTSETSQASFFLPARSIATVLYKKQ